MTTSTAKDSKAQMRSKKGLATITKLAREGKTLQEIAKHFNITARCLYNWSRTYTEIGEAIAEGKKVADDLVEQSLYESCLAHDVKEIYIEKDAQGNIIKQIVKTKHIPANTQSMQYWLQNRRNDRWKDRRQMEFSSDGALPVMFVSDIPNPFLKTKEDTEDE